MSRLTTKMEPRPRIDKALPEAVEAQSDPIPLPKPPVVLGIGLPKNFTLNGVELRRPANDRAVIELLRQTEFDLLLVSAAQQDAKVWTLLQLVRRHWPGLRWVLMTEDCTDALEIQARSLGAVCVTADQRTIEELAFS